MTNNENTTQRVISTVIRELRRNKDYSQDYMAEKLGISQNAYSKLESGRTAVTVERLVNISSILEVKPLDILARAGIDNG